MSNKIRAIFFLFLAACSMLAYGQQYSIHAEVWARPRTGERLLQLPGLRQFLQAWQQTPNSGVEIRYPGGETGVLWAEELQSWLVAMGVPSALIRSSAGSSVEDSIELKLRRLP